MKNLFQGLLVAASLLIASAFPVKADGIFNPGSSGGGGGTGTPAQVINVTDFGARCDGLSTPNDDTTAINNAFAAALASAAYTNNKAVEVTGPLDAAHKGCNVTQINATGFTSNTSGAQLIIANLTLNGSGAGNITLDMVGSWNVTTSNLTIIGSSASPPAIGLQEGNINPVSLSCCVHEHWNLRVEGTFTFTASYNAAAESTSYYYPIIRNDGPTVGPIRALGSVTGGSTYTNGTYTNVPLTGGTGAGALATVVVAGNVVSTVTLTYQGKGYTPTNALSAAAANIGGTGSGFSVPVSTITPYAMVLDGQNHWRMSSAFQSVTWTPDTYFTFSQLNIFGGAVKYFGSSTNGAPLWIAAENGHTFNRTYFANTATAECVQLFDNGIATGGNSALTFNMRCESPSVNNAFFLYGSKNTPVLTMFNYKDDLDEAQIAIFGVDTNITSVTASNVNIELAATLATPNMFSSAIWTLTGKVNVPSNSMWNPSVFYGLLCSPVGCTTPALAKSGAISSVTGTLTETPLATIPIPAKLLGANGALRITTMWNVTNNANVKSVRVRLGGTGVTGSIIFVQSNLTAITNLRADTFLMAANATNAQNTITSTPRGTDFILVDTSPTTVTAVDMTSAQNIVLTGQLASTSDTVSLIGYIIEVVN